MRSQLSPLILSLIALVACRSSQGVEAPVASSAAPMPAAFSQNDLRPPSGDQNSEPNAFQNLGAETAVIEADLRSEASVHPSEAAGPAMAPESSPLALAAGLYVEAQSLESSHAYPQAVAAYDRLLEREWDYADAQDRRNALLELVVLADAFYVRAMDADSDEERLAELQQVVQFWPEYRDASEQVAQLKRAAAELMIELSALDSEGSE